MEITKKNEHFTIDITLDEVEAKAIMHAFERLAYITNYPVEQYLHGIDADIYQKLKSVFDEGKEKKDGR